MKHAFNAEDYTEDVPFDDDEAPKEKRSNGAGRAGSGTSAALESVCAADVDAEAITWVWPNRFARRKLGLLVGLPDEGKGQVFAYVAARITNAALNAWPCSEGIAPHGNIVLLTAEDDLNDTVIPRLTAAGADLNRVHIIKMVRDRRKKRMFSLVSDLELLRQKIVEVGDVVMVQIDPISAYLGVGKVDSFRGTDVRAVLAPLVDVAVEFDLCILAIMHFNKRSDVTNVLLRVTDSLAFGATARHVYAVVDDAEHDRKLFVRGKNNIAPKKASGLALAYSFNAKMVGIDKRNGKEIWAPYIDWHPQHIDVTALEAMQAAADNKAPAARENAKQFLANILAGGPMLQKDIEDMAKADCISVPTLRRAKKDLGVVPEKQKDVPDGPWLWRLPQKEQAR